MKDFLLTLIVLVCFVNQPSAQTVSIYFDTDKSILKNEARRALNSLIEMAETAKPDTINITCHCDNRADSAYNYALSMRRAQSTKKYLFNNGLDVPFVLFGKGDALPQYANTAQTRFKNRRCDVVFITRQIQPNSFVQRDISLWKPGMRFLLDSLEFVGNQAVPNAYSMPVLDQLYKILTAYPDLEIAIQGHVCCGDDLPLSVARAKAVYDFLVLNGIASTRLSYEGFSNYKPLTKEIDEASEQANRRVEIKITAPPNQIQESALLPSSAFNVVLREIAFKPKAADLTTVASFNLNLLAAMIKESSGYTYELSVNASTKTLQQKRVQRLANYFRQQQISTAKLVVKPGQNHAHGSGDVLILEVNPQRK